MKPLLVDDTCRVESTQAPEIVLRPRLLRLLAQRFETRVTLIEAAAGFGKSTLVHQAMAENSLISDGLDVFVTCAPTMSDGNRLLTEILKKIATASGGSEGATSISEAILAEAPHRVCIVLDDLDRLAPGSPALQMVNDLARDMPRNGHLLISTRPPVQLQLARLAASGNVIRLTEAELGFDDDELSHLLGPGLAGVIDPATLRWPVMAGLTRSVGRAESESYLWEEVLRPMDPTQRLDLARLSLFDAVDQELASSIGIDSPLSSLLATVPLAPVRDGVARLHALWRPVLAPLLDDEDRNRTLLAGAAHLRSSGKTVEAAQRYAEAGSVEGITGVAADITGHLLSSTRLADVLAIDRLLPEKLRQTSLGRYVRSIGRMSTSLTDAMADLETLAMDAAAEGETDLAIRSLWRSIQIDGLLTGFPAGPHLAGEVEAIAASGNTFAQAVDARHRAVVALSEGRADEALRIGRTEFGGFGSDAGVLFGNLGIDSLDPEAVLMMSATLENMEGAPDEDDLTEDGAVDLFGAQALWFSGLVDPVEVAPVALSLTNLVENQQMRQQDLMMNCAVANVLFAAGEEVDAERLVARAAELGSQFEGTHLEAFGRVASAALLSYQGNEDAAEGELLEALAVAPIYRWPHRPFLTAIAALSSLTSNPLTDVPVDQMGAPFQLAVQAGEALKSWRKGDPDPAAALPWHQSLLLRAHVWPNQLAELAIAALSAGEPPSESIGPVIASLPDASTRLRRIIDRQQQIGDHVRSFVAHHTDPTHTALEISTLGQFKLSINGEPLESPEWLRRERVRELMAVLVQHRRIMRVDAAQLLWPDAPSDKASANLRTNLRHLQNCLEPDRRSEGTWFVRSDSMWLELPAQRFSLDANQFERCVADARRHEAQGLPSLALECYQIALEHYQGDYFAEFVDSNWLEFDRIRLRSLAAQASARVAELLLARGEPEASVLAADRAVRMEPLFERAHRARVRGLLGQEDRSAARSAMEVTYRLLAEMKLTPEPDTVKLASSLGLTYDT